MPKVKKIAGTNAWQAVKNAGKASGKVIAAQARGERVSRSKEEQEKLMATCRACPTDKFNGLRCVGCGCFSKLKTRLATESCPDGHW